MPIVVLHVINAEDVAWMQQTFSFDVPHSFVFPALVVVDAIVVDIGHISHVQA